MITALVSIDVDSAQIPEVAQTIANMASVDQVFSVTGDTDLIALVRVRAHEDLADVIAGDISKVPGVLTTSTNIAFRTYSAHDLDAAFDLGAAD